MSITHVKHRATTLAVFPLFLCQSFALADNDASAIVKVLQPYVARHELAGAVTMVVTRDKTLALDAVGYADVAKKKPMQADAIFWIASMSKPITATALMMLVDEQKVRLDDPVIKYLPNFKPQILVVSDGHVKLQPPRHPITVRNLLSHTSGIPYQSSLEIPASDRYPLATRVNGYVLEPLQFEPGSDFMYSSGGINTAGRIVEVVSEVSFAKFLQSRLFEPLAMKDTTFWPTQAQFERLAKSYGPNATGNDLEEIPIKLLEQPLNPGTRRYVFPAGGLFSTAIDLGRFCQMLLNGGVLAEKRYLSEAAIHEMTRNQLTDPQLGGAGSGYGLGWYVSLTDGTFGHSGAYSTKMTVDPRHGIATIWLIQHQGFPGSGENSENDFEQTVTKLFSGAGIAKR